MQELISFISKEKARIGPATRMLVELLSDIANASAQSGDSQYLLAKRLNRILSSPRGEGRTIKQDFLVIANLYTEGLLTYLKQAYSDLTGREIGLCGMITLGFDPGCICKILGYMHEQTFYNRRSDVRKKLQLEGQTVTLEEFLQSQVERLRKQHETDFLRLKERY